MNELPERIDARARGVRYKVIEGLVLSLLPPEPVLDSHKRARVEEDTIEFVIAQMTKLPSFLRIPYVMVSHVFNWLALLRYGRRFIDLDVSRQRMYLAAWSTSPMRAMRDFIKLIRSCAYLQYLDHPLVNAELVLGRD